jgi:hypothetical protein
MNQNQLQVQYIEIRLHTKTLTWSEPHLLPKVSSDKFSDAHLFQKVMLSPLPGIDETENKQQTLVNSKPHHHHKQDQTREQ